MNSCMKTRSTFAIYSQLVSASPSRVSNVAPRFSEAVPLKFRLGLSLFIGLLLACSSGCNRGTPELYVVRGKVTHNGKPISKLYLVFRPTDQRKAAESCALTDQNGNFEMMIGSTIGVFPGEHTITVEDPLKADGRQVRLDPDYLAVTEKYSPETSTYKMDIKKHWYDLELKLD